MKSMSSRSRVKGGRARVRRVRIASRLIGGAFLAAAAGLAWPLAACSSTDGSSKESPGAPSSSTSAEGTTPQSKLDELRKRLDAELLAGPSVTEALGYRSVWQTKVETAGGSRLRGCDLTADEYFVWDSVGVISRLRPSSGDTIWQAASGSRVDRILSIIPVDLVSGAARVALVTDTQLFLYDASNGIFASRQGFDRMANTPAVLRPPFVVYGTRAGQLVWHNFEVGGEGPVTQLPGSIAQAPRLVGRTVVAASTGGGIGAYEARSGRLIWEKSMNAGISARPAASDAAVWVPCKDQYLTCFSIRDGRPLWRYFTQSTMDASPTFLDDALYMQLPGEGLVCFEPVPPDKFDGVVRWRSKDAVGDVIGLCRNGLIAWEPKSRMLSLLEERTGAVIRALPVPGVVDLELTDPIDGDLLLTGDDGRVQRLTPIARRPLTKP